MNVRVHAKNGGDHVVVLLPNFNMHTIRVAISNATGIAPDQQRLVQHGEVLAEDYVSHAMADTEPLHVIPRTTQPVRAIQDYARLSMFALGQDRICDAQECGSVFADLFEDFVDDSAWTCVADDAELAELQRAARVLAASASGVPFEGSPQPDLHSEPHVIWFPPYGCALIADIVRPGAVRIQLVALDGWEFSIHSGHDEQGRQHQSHAGHDAAKQLYVGTVEPETVQPGSDRRSSWEQLGTVARFQMFMELAMKLLDVAAARSGNQRSAAKSQQGNPKTPGLVEAVLHDALNGLDQREEPDEGSTAPQGGFTDVGRHTGGTARNTTWPLVRAVLQIMLEDRKKHELYRLTMVQLRLWVTERWLSSLSSEGITAEQVNITMQMLVAIQEDAVPLSDERVDMGAVEARCAVVRFELQNLVTEQAHAAASKFKLRSDDFNGRYLDLCPPGIPALPDDSHWNLEVLRDRAKQNLGWLPCPLGADTTWRFAKDWLTALDSQQHTSAALLALSGVEHFFYRQTETSLAPDAAHLFGASEEAVLIEDIVDLYRCKMDALIRSPDGQSLLVVELRSRETLVAWVAFCLVHAATKRTCDLLCRFAVPLHGDDMRHLVLSKRRATDAAVRVANYLRSNARGPPVFSLRKDDRTFVFAQEFARTDKMMQEMWKTEKQEADEREDAHWREVNAKKTLLRDLDDQLVWQERELSTQQSIKTVFSFDRNQAYWDAHWKVDQLESEVAATKSRIKKTECPPAAVFQPLPDQEDEALPIIFFLIMPREFQVLLRMGFTAQQMLVPAESSITLAGSAAINIPVRNTICRFQNDAVGNATIRLSCNRRPK
eukprot:SAG11_NODE_331_length_10659_cov_4.512689_1_plen_833_part_00